MYRIGIRRPVTALALSTILLAMSFTAGARRLLTESGQASSEPKKCTLSLEKLSLNRGRSWSAADETKTVTDLIRFTSPRDGKILLITRESGKAVFEMSGATLTNVRGSPGLTATLTPEGDLAWSNGMISALNNKICPKAVVAGTKKSKSDSPSPAQGGQPPKCKLTLELLAGKRGKSWKTRDATKTTTDLIRFSSVRNGKIILTTRESGKHRLRMAGKVLLKEVSSGTPVNGTPTLAAVLTSEGTLNWSDGTTSTLN